MLKKLLHNIAVSGCATLALGASSGLMAAEIVHDAEYYVIEAQNGERWDADDKKVDIKLAELRKANNGKPPNILYILLDDVGFGEIGMPDLEVTRGYKTPNIDSLARDGLSLQRMYTEPSCTPTRVAMMTGRHPVRTGLVDAKATLAGEGLSGKEVTIAEVLRKAGYETSHVGKWHLGDIQESWAHKQGFNHAEFPIHQQAQLALFPVEAQHADISRGIDPDGAAQTFTLDHHFAPKPGDMVTGVEFRDGGIYEVDLQPGEKWTQQKYREMNERYQRSAMSELKRLAQQEKPFYLNYWPLFPLNFVRTDIEKYQTLNGGTVAETLVEVDAWIGELLAEVQAQGIAQNTLIIVMGDNGPFMKYAGASGQADRIYRGAKGDSLEGGVRVNAYVRWPAAIKPGTSALDIVHVSDLYTTLSRIGGGIEHVPTDRVIDGIDQTSILLMGETHGRRDYVYIYEGPTLKAVVKNKYKFQFPPAGANPILFAKFYDLYRDPREERPQDSIKYGAWAGGQFEAMIQRHMKLRKKYPDRALALDEPYEGIRNLRPETLKLLENYKRSN